MNALDDPIVPGKIIPYSQIIANPHIIIATTCYGGHLGWYSNLFLPKRWFGKPVSEFLAALSVAFSSLPKNDDLKFNSGLKSIKHKHTSMQTQESIDFPDSDNPENQTRTIKFFSGQQSQSQQLLRPTFFSPWKLGSLIALLSFLIKYWRGRK